MLTEHVERYLALRLTLGYSLRETGRDLRAFAKLAQNRGEEFVTTETAALWADAAPSVGSRSIRMKRLILFANFLHAEDERHEVPLFENYRYEYVRPLPYIYSPEEISKLIAATAKLKKHRPHRKEMYHLLIGLISVTGLRVSEALNLKITDIAENGTLQIRDTKFGKSRMVPLHPTTFSEVQRYLTTRQQWVFETDYLFTARTGKRLSIKTFHYVFHTILKIAGVTPPDRSRPRIHDLRHTFATRTLEKCPTNQKDVNKNFVALSTYLGHVDIKATYWYFETTPELMRDVAEIVEQFAGGLS